jgi:general secretion pathway protein G
MKKKWLRLLNFLILVSILLILGSLHKMDIIYNSRAKVTHNHLFILINALENFKKDVGQYPSVREGLKALISRPPKSEKWKGPYLTPQELSIIKNINHDVWGTKYIYIYPAKYSNEPYDLYSCGKNRRDDQGQKDDITYWKGNDETFYGKD